MKSSEFHRFVQINGWKEIRQVGSHIIYEKNGKQITVPYQKQGNEKRSGNENQKGNGTLVLSFN